MYYFIVTSVTFLGILIGQTTVTAVYTATTPAQVVDQLNNCSSPENTTMEKEFFTKVRSTFPGVCLNLPFEQNNTMNSTFVVIHTERVNQSDIYMNKHWNFPCSNCSNPHAIANISMNISSIPACLTLTQYSENIDIYSQSMTRLSDVISLSLFDLQQSTFVTSKSSDRIHLQIPLKTTPVVSILNKLECRSLSYGTWQWTPCDTKQQPYEMNGGLFVECTCNTLGWYTVFLKKEDSFIDHARNRLSLVLDTDCGRYLTNSTIKAEFLNTTRFTIAKALDVNVVYLVDMSANCGSIIVNFTLISPNRTTQDLEEKIDQLGRRVSSNQLIVNIGNHRIYPYWLHNYGGSIPGNITYLSLYYRVKYATSAPKTTPSMHPLEMNYKPLVIAVAFCVFSLIFCICFTCICHSWYLHKKKYTDYNSDKNVPKPVEPVEEEEEPISEFSMTYNKIQKPDERAIPKYDWARTSYAPEPTDAAFITSYADNAPRLILDEEDEESVKESVAIDVDSQSSSDSTESDSEEERSIPGEIEERQNDGDTLGYVEEQNMAASNVQGENVADEMNENKVQNGEEQDDKEQDDKEYDKEQDDKEQDDKEQDDKEQDDEKQDHEDLDGKEHDDKELNGEEQDEELNGEEQNEREQNDREHDGTLEQGGNLPVNEESSVVPLSNNEEQRFSSDDEEDNKERPESVLSKASNGRFSRAKSQGGMPEPCM